MIYLLMEIHKVMLILYRQMIHYIFGMAVSGYQVVLFKVQQVHKVLKVHKA